MKKTVLKIDTVSYEQITTLGIVSVSPDYKLSWLLNNAFNISLTQTTDITISFKNNNEVTFAFYMYEDEASQRSWELFGNKNEDGVLIKQLKNIDYILQIYGILTESEIKAIKQQLIGISLVSAAILVENLSNRSLKNIIF